jgi:protein-disulfide isomerase
MKSSGEAKLLLILGLIVLLGGGALVGLNALQGKSDSPIPQATPQVVEMNAERFDALLKSSRHIKGEANAPVTMIEFADFECPSCRRGYNSVLKPLLKKGNIRFAFRHYPLPQHTNAMPAATAVEAAAKQGKFWELYERLFEGESTELSRDYITEQAKKVGLDMKKFEADLGDASLAAFVDADRKAAAEYGVDMTPTFFIRAKDGTFHQAVGGDQFGELVKKLGL